MKICAIICEYNPFHYGHKYLIDQAKLLSDTDAILCIMSGNFVQRGEAAILEKHRRAEIAVECGADIVVELPTVFATSNAEIFARGAISILEKIPQVTHLCFGVESGDKDSFLHAAKLLATEPKEVSAKLQGLMDEGVSYAAALTQAREAVLSENLLSSPNNILGLEYAKAILSAKASIEILPVVRNGGKYHDTRLDVRYPSATAIRKACTDGKLAELKQALPPPIFSAMQDANIFDLSTAEKIAVIKTDACLLAETLDCNEGLENAFKKAATLPPTFSESLTSPRYTASRIRRIALQNLLEIRKAFVFGCLMNPLYIRPLAYNADRKDVLSALSKAKIPFLACGQDRELLQGVAAKCLQTDILAEDVYAALAQKIYDNKTIVKKSSPIDMHPKS